MDVEGSNCICVFVFMHFHLIFQDGHWREEQLWHQRSRQVLANTRCPLLAALCLPCLLLEQNQKVANIRHLNHWPQTQEFQIHFYMVDVVLSHLKPWIMFWECPRSFVTLKRTPPAKRCFLSGIAEKGGGMPLPELFGPFLLCISP